MLMDGTGRSSYSNGILFGFLDFGPNNKIAAMVPRINVWKGDMIKTYNSFHSLGSGSFGKRPT